MRTRDRMYLGRIRSVRNISRDDRARIATCSLRTTTDRLKANYSIDIAMVTWFECLMLVRGSQCVPMSLSHSMPLFHNSMIRPESRRIVSLKHAHDTSTITNNKKGSFYIAQYPVHWTAHSALHFTPLADLFIPTPFSASPGSILATQQWRERKCPIFEMVAKGDSNPGSLDCESGILPLSYCAPQQSKAIVIQPVGKRPRGRPQNRWEDDIPQWYREIGIPMTEVNNWVKGQTSECIST